MICCAISPVGLIGLFFSLSLKNKCFMNNFPGCSAGCYFNRYLSYLLNAQTSTKNCHSLVVILSSEWEKVAAKHYLRSIKKKKEDRQSEIRDMLIQKDFRRRWTVIMKNDTYILSTAIKRKNGRKIKKGR